MSSGVQLRSFWKAGAFINGVVKAIVGGILDGVAIPV